jgi:hypothetical protein
MDEVVNVMSLIFPFFSGHDEPVQYSSEDGSTCSSAGQQLFSYLDNIKVQL